MAARKKIVGRAVAQGMSVKRALAVAEIPRSTYYYRPNGKRIGKAPSTPAPQSLLTSHLLISKGYIII